VTPRTWPRELRKLWQINVGEGHASPVVAGKTVYVFARQKDDEVLLGINLSDGKELFRQAYAAPYEVNPVAASHGKGPKSTPIVANGRVLTLGISGILTCRDAHTGKLRWQHDFSKEFEATSPLYGTAMSPIVHAGLCIAHVGGHDDGALEAYALDTGKRQWSWDHDDPGYASPIIAKLAGTEQLITQSQGACLAVTPDSGKLLWKTPFTTEYEQNAVTPLAHQGLVILGGYNQPTRAVRITRDGAAWSLKDVWANANIPMYLSSPVASGDAFFGMTHKNSGQLFCADVRTGKVHWTGKPRLGQNAALLVTGDALLVLTSQARLLVVKLAADSYQELASYKVADTPTWAHPAVVEGNKILIKDRNNLTLWSF
jgi:outer membrane protein assembly factor BamB